MAKVPLRNEGRDWRIRSPSVPVFALLGAERADGCVGYFVSVEDAGT